MADLLVRNISEGLKREIEQRARRNRRNLSEETKALIRGGLAISAKPIKVGTFHHPPISNDLARHKCCVRRVAGPAEPSCTKLVGCTAC